MLDAASRWDGSWYLSVARDGYDTAELAFFPLYPLLMRAIGTILGSSDEAYLAAGVLISAVALAAAVSYVARLAALERDEATGSRAALYLLVFPTSVFLAAAYAESLFLALAAGSLYHARRGEWPLAGALGALAALTRPLGALVFVPLLVERALGGRLATRGTAWALMPAAALAAWMGVLWRMTGDPLAYLAAQASFGRRVAVPLGAFADLFDPAVYHDPWIVLASTVFVLALVAISWRVLRRSLAAYATAFFLGSIATGTLTSTPRYYLAIFPVFIALAIVAPAIAGRAYVVVSVALGTILTAMFALGYWVA